jgi:hypothetical protein
MTSTDAQQEARDRTALRRFEILATILLALATVATAWSSYQATRWNGEASKAAGRANAQRIESAKAADRGNAFAEIDVITFTQWVDAYATGEDELRIFYEERFREEFKPAFEAWIATDPLVSEDAPLTPFQMPEYVRADIVESERLAAEGEEAAANSREYIQRASNYILGVVLFAAALFFAGLSTRFTSPPARIAVLVLGSIVFVGTVIWLVTLPVTVSV